MSMRRTRAMGMSPSGLKSLDMDAPTRKPRKIRTSSDKPASASNAARAKSDPKRKYEVNIDEERPTKKTRRNEPSARSTRIKTSQQEPESLSDEQALVLTRRNGSTPKAQKDISSGHDEEAAVESDQISDARANKQQPTPPSEAEPTRRTPSQPASAARATRRSGEEVAMREQTLQQIKKRDNAERHITNILNTRRRHRGGLEEEEIALSDCDDDEWARRFPLEMSRYNDLTSSVKKPNSSFIEWVRGSTAIFVTRSPKQGKEDTTARNTGRPCMTTTTFLHFTSPSSSFPKMRAIQLTHTALIAAVSASLDWFEKNPSAVTPTPAEMTSMLESFNRSKQSQVIDNSDDQASLAGCDDSQNKSRSVNGEPRTPVWQPTYDDLSDDAVSLQADKDEDMQWDEGGLRNEKQAPLSEDALGTEDKKEEAAPTFPQTPQKGQQLEDTRGWASVLSASVIGNVFRTPVNWFTRRDRARQTAPVTEPRPVRVDQQATRSAKSRRPLFTQAHSPVVRGNKTMPAKNRSSKLKENSIQPSTPTPASRELRRVGRPDAHLPVHLRGVRFEDLPAEYQAVSQHMKRAEPTEEEEAVDLPTLLEIARKTREERRVKELQEKAERIAHEQATLESEEDSHEQVGEKRKRRVTLTQHKTFSAKLGPSTFGMPENIDDSSSDEEIQVEVEVPRVSPRKEDRRMNPPLKSSLRRSRSKVLRSNFETFEDGDDEDEDAAPPSKRLRFNDSTDSEETAPQARPFISSREVIEQQYRARPAPSDFISTPPRERARIEQERDEFEQYHPLVSDDPAMQEDLDLLLEMCVKIRKEDNVFKKQAAAEVETRRNRRIDSFSSSPEPSPEPMALQESSEERLNKVREKALQYKPKVPSGLSHTQIMSPIASQKKLLGDIPMDAEVLKAIESIPDDEILAEIFANHLPTVNEGTVSREASRAISPYEPLKPKIGSMA